MLILALPIALISLSLYLALILIGSSLSVWIEAALFGLVASYFFIKPDFKNSREDFRNTLGIKNSFLILIVLFVVLAKAFVLSPFVVIKDTGGFKHIQLTGVGDYYKHSFVTSALIQDGIPPKNPYFPVANLSYYFGYYLVPAAVSRIFHVFPNISFYAFCLVADFIGFLLILEVINKTLKNYWYKLLAILLLVFGVGIDAIPFVFNTLGQAQNDQGLQLINNFKSLIFNPQHFFAAALTVWITHKLLYDKLKLLPLSLISTFIFLSSIFVGLTYIFWLGLIFIFKPNLRSFLFKTGLLSLVVLVPFLLTLSDRGNLFYFYQFKPFAFTSNFIVNTLATFFVKYGPMLILLPLSIFLTKKYNLGFILGIGLPLIITWFVRSPVFNDFSMRTSMPIQLILPVLFLELVQGIKQKYSRYILLMLTIITILIGAKGFYLEYLNDWRSREIFAPKNSELILKVRSLPDNVKLAALDRDRWVELIPSLAFKKITNPYLYDSYIYLAGTKVSNNHAVYESQAKQLFLEPITAENPEKLVNLENSNLSKLHDFFSKYPVDLLIVNNQLWLKKDTNPWLMIFKNMGVGFENFTSYYTAFKYPELLQKTKDLKVTVLDTPEKSVAKDRRISIKEGVNFLVTCKDKFPIEARLEFEDYNLVFSKQLNSTSRCIGQFFYLEKPEDVLMSINSSVEYLYIYPLKIESN